MRENFLKLNLAQRRMVFFMVVVGGIVLFIAIALALILGALNTGRRTAQPLMEGVTLREYAALPDDDAYPATITVAPDGTVYTASFATGAIWQISPAGDVTEIAGTRDWIGAASGLAVAQDGALIVVDQLNTDPRAAGGDVKRVTLDGDVNLLADIPDERGFITPDDVTLDAEGNIYVTDRGHNEVWRFASDGTNAQMWWTPPATAETETRGAITGIAYDPSSESIIISDPDLNRIYRVDLATVTGKIIYQHTEDGTSPPGFDGITITPDGAIYVAALGENAIVRVEEKPDGANGTLHYLARYFRGASDVAYHAPNHLYVTNWDQVSLVNPLVYSQLPFAIDEITIP